MDKDFYLIISQLLKDLNMTQEAFAKELGISQGTVSKWFAGLQEPGYKMLRKICKVFNIDGNEVLGLD